MDRLRNRVPSPGALIAFEAVARQLGFTAAARELGVSQAAASRQVRLLEEDLGVRLFRREGRSVRLTEAGRDLYLAVSSGLGHIAATADGLRARGRGAHLTVATSIAFSAFWLMPRIGAFQASRPDSELHLVTGDSVEDWLADDTDVAIAYGDGTWPGRSPERLFGDEILPVCHPAYVDKHGLPRTVADLLDHTLLQFESGHTSWIGWPVWLERCGVVPDRPLHGPHFTSYTIAIQAARDGQGIALGWRRLVQPMLDDGSMVRVTPGAVVPNNAYYLLIPKRRESDPTVRAFRDWLVDQAALDWR